MPYRCKHCGVISKYAEADIFKFHAQLRYQMEERMAATHGRTKNSAIHFKALTGLKNNELSEANKEATKANTKQHKENQPKQNYRIDLISNTIMYFSRHGWRRGL